jgi:Zn-dependent protease with chaperone function
MDALAAARAMLPPWVPIIGVVPPLLVALVGSLAVATLGRRIAGRPEQTDAHWSERARLAYPLRMTAGALIVFNPLVFGAMATFWVGPISWTSPLVAGLIVASASVAVGVWRHRAWMPTYLTEPPSLGYWLRGIAVLLLVMRPFLLVLVVLALLTPLHPWSLAGLAWLAGGLLLAAATMTGQAVRLAALLRLAKPASARLRAVVERASVSAGRSAPPTWELRWPMANAAAFPLGNKLVFSDAALAVLSDDELVAICRHELAHLAEPRSVMISRALVSLIWIPFAGVLARTAQWGVEVTLAATAVVVLVALVVRRLQRRMEHRADDHAHDDDDDSSYARALEAIYRHNGVPAVLFARGVHPHLYDRLEAAGTEPDFPRPRPPSRARGAAAMVAMMLVATALAAGSPLAMRWTFFEQDEPDDDRDALALAIGAGGAWELASMADRRVQRGPIDEAVVFFEAAVATSQWPPLEYGARAQLVALYAQTNRCADAARHLAWLDVHADAQDDPSSTVFASSAMSGCRDTHAPP